MQRLAISLFLLLTLACSAPKNEQTSQEEPHRIITAGGTLSEIVVALGLEDQIIATDRTSTFPSRLQQLPSIGYRNQIKAEGLLSLNPSLILLEEGYLGEAVVAQLTSSNIPVKTFPKATAPAETKDLIRALANQFDLKDAGEELISTLEKDLKQLEEFKAETTAGGKAVFVMARGPESLFIAGKGSFASAMFDLAGVSSVETDFENFVPLSPEALIQLNPEYLVLFESGLESLGGKAGLSQIPGLTQTTAYKQAQIITLDGLYLSGFGPRVAQAALDLAKAIRTTPEK